MGQLRRLSTVLTAGLLILILNAYMVISERWDWSFDLEPLAVSSSVADLRVDRLPSGAG